MKIVLAIFFSTFIISTVRSQSDSITTLSCNTWGKPDWSKFEKYANMQGGVYLGAIRERDGNINEISPYAGEIFSDDVFVRWTLRDTSVFYDIRILNEREELLFESTSNKCGIRIPFAALLEETTSNVLMINVGRNKKHLHVPWGISFRIEEARKSYRKRINEELAELLAKTAGDRKNLAVINYFIDSNRIFDALCILELALEKDPGNETLVKKYWLTVNDMFIAKARR